MQRYTEEAMLAKELGVSSNHVCIVGSTLICGSGNDTDFLCLVADEEKLVECGFAPDLNVEYESPLRSYRRDRQNVIAITDAKFYFAEVAIAHAAQQVASGPFDMAARADRIRFHSAVRSMVLQRMLPELLEAF